METIYIKDTTKIYFKWDIYKGATTVREDFSNAQAWCILTGVCDRWPVPATLVNGTWEGQLPTCLPAGIYSIMMVWAKDMYPVQSVKETFGAGKRNMAEVKDFVCISSDPVKAKEEYIINMTSFVSTYGYDGMSAWELAVTRGMTELTEKEWIQARMGQIETSQIANGAVTTGKIADLAVTMEKIADHNITTEKLAPEAIQKFCKESVFWTDDETDIKDLDAVYLERLAAAEDDIDDINVRLLTTVSLENGKIPSAYLPGSFAEMVEYSSKAAFPATGDSSKIYIDKSTNKTWRWTGTQYTEISSSLALGETQDSAYPGNKGKAAYDSMVTGFETSRNGTRYTLTIEQEDGTTQNAFVDTATTENVGLMSTSDKSKLDSFTGVSTTMATNTDVPSVGGMKTYLQSKYISKEIGGEVRNLTVTEDLVVGVDSAHASDCGIESYGKITSHENIESDKNIVAEGGLETDGNLRVEGTSEFDDTITVKASGTTETITPTKIGNWNTAYGWGNHANAGYLTSASVANKADKATTLAGYGITDAKIESGVVTLGNNTITPLTSGDVVGQVPADPTTSSKIPTVACVNTLVSGKGYLTSADITSKANTNSPAFTGTVTLPATTFFAGMGGGVLKYIPNVGITADTTTYMTSSNQAAAIAPSLTGWASGSQVYSFVTGQGYVKQSEITNSRLINWNDTDGAGLFSLLSQYTASGIRDIILYNYTSYPKATFRLESMTYSGGSNRKYLMKAEMLESESLNNIKYIYLRVESSGVTEGSIRAYTNEDLGW